MTAFTRRLKGDMGDTFNFETVAAAFAALWLTEVNSAGQLAYAENIETVSGDIRAQRAEFFQPLIELRRTQVAEQLKVFTQRQQRAALWLLSRRQVFPFWAADGAKQHGVGIFAAFDGGFWQRRTVVINGNTAHVVMAGGDFHRKTRANGFQYFQRLCHHFRANTVTRQHSNMVILRHYTVSLLFSLF